MKTKKAVQRVGRARVRPADGLVSSWKQALLLPAGASLLRRIRPLGSRRMWRQFLLSGLLASGVAWGADAEAPAIKMTVVVIPVRDEIADPTLYIVRRGLKDAEAKKADLIVLDMKTPGGALDATFEMMEALGKFSGRTITYVNDQALSAGAFISATTEEIWFAPRGKIGAAAPVSAGGQDIDKSMKQKIVSYLKAEVRSCQRHHFCCYR